MWLLTWFPNCRDEPSHVVGLNAWIVHTYWIVRLIGSCTSEWNFLRYCQSAASVVSFFFFTSSSPLNAPPVTHLSPSAPSHISGVTIAPLSELRELMRDNLERKTRERTSHLFKWPPSPSHTSLTPDQWSRCHSWTILHWCMCSHTHTIYF